MSQKTTKKSYINLLTGEKISTADYNKLPRDVQSYFDKISSAKKAIKSVVFDDQLDEEEEDNYYND